jgi:hypothetical protein
MAHKLGMMLCKRTVSPGVIDERPCIQRVWPVALGIPISRVPGHALVPLNTGTVRVPVRQTNIR